MARPQKAMPVRYMADATVPEAVVARYEALAAQRQHVAHVMAHDSDHDGRGTVTDATLGVNATETRVTPRWQASQAAQRTLESGNPFTTGTVTMTVSSRRLRQRGYRAAVAAAQGGGRQWQPFAAEAAERQAGSGSASRREAALLAAEALAERLSERDAQDRLLAALGSVHAEAEAAEAAAAERQAAADAEADEADAE